jgi:histone acetyltransferase (RNA polymerase elongator complex component)
MTGSLLLLCVSISAKLLCCPSGECRYIPGEGEEEAEDGYFGKRRRTQRTLHNERQGVVP